MVIEIERFNYKVSYQVKRPDSVRKNQEDAQNATIYILKQYGPTYYLLQDHTEQKYKVYLGDVHTCSCENFTKNRELCIHLCWMLVKRFKVDPNNPISWQPGLVEREISALLDGQHSLVNKTTSLMESTILSKNNLNEKLLFNTQRKIEENDICPICQEYFFSRIRLPVTFCRKNCGNSIHIRCMKVWTDYQRKQNSLGSLDYIKCPICREDFAPLHILLREFTESLNAENKKSTKCKPISKITITDQDNDIRKKLNLETIPAKHLNTRCLSCLCSPILGNIYRCEICHQLGQEENLNPFLCSTCFRCDKHLQHNLFVYRETPYGRWLDVPPSRGAIKNHFGQLINKLQDTSESFQLSSTENCNHLLFNEGNKPLQLAELAYIRQWTIKLPRNRSEFIISKTSDSENSNDNKTELKKMSPMSSTGLLSPGRQCLLCLMSFKVNDKVRQLSPGCQHIFHSDCIDPWLLHKSSTCPIDEILVQPEKTINEKSLTNCKQRQKTNELLNDNLNELKILAKHIERKPKIKAKPINKVTSRVENSFRGRILQ